MEKRVKTKSGKKSKQRMTVKFIVASDGLFAFEPTIIWRSKRSRCFKSLKDPLRPMSLHYFSNKKALMDFLLRLDHKMCLEKRKFVLFWGNATCHPEILQASLTNTSLVFLPKNTTSRLQALDVGIIRNFRHKLQKAACSLRL